MVSLSNQQVQCLCKKEKYYSTRTCMLHFRQIRCKNQQNFCFTFLCSLRFHEKLQNYITPFLFIYNLRFSIFIYSQKERIFRFLIIMTCFRNQTELENCVSLSFHDQNHYKKFTFKPELCT